MPSLEPEKVFDRYRIERLLGRGGMGEVYAAYDLVLRRRVALKVLRPTAALGVAAAEALLREARAAAALTHRSSVAVFDVGEAEGTPFIAMELVDGKPLRAYVGDPGVPFEDKVAWLVEVARMLGAAHAAGLVHRDVKPENVMVCVDGAIKVLDFGIAKRAEPGGPAPSGDPASASFHTAAGLVRGTPKYMAPERLMGEPFDGRSDQFAWGLLAYELFTGRHPWGGGIGDLLSRQSRPPPLLHEIAPAVPLEVSTVVARAIAYRPDDRFASMDEVARALAGPPPARRSERPPSSLGPPEEDEPDTADTVLSPLAPPRSAPAPAPLPATAPLPAPAPLPATAPLPAPARVAAPGRRARVEWRRVGLGLALAAIAGTGTGLVWSRRRPPAIPVDGARTTLTSASSSAPTPPLVFHPRRLRRFTVSSACEKLPSFSPDSRRLAYGGEVGKNSQIFVRALDEEVARSITQVEGRDLAPAFSPDGARIAFLRIADGKSETFVVDAEGARPARRIATGRVRPSWSRDGRSVWAGDPVRPARYDAETGAVLETVTAPGPASHAIELAGGALLVNLFAPFGGGQESAEAGLAVLDHDRTVRWLLHQPTAEAVAVTPDGRHALVSKIAPSGGVDLVDAPIDGSPTSSVAGSGLAPTQGVDVAPDGRHVAWSTCEASVRVARVGPGGVEDAVLGDTAYDEQAIAWLPGTPRVVVASRRGGPTELWVFDLTRKAAPRRLSTGDTSPIEVAASDDAAWLAFSTVEGALYGVAAEGDAAPRRIAAAEGASSPSFRRRSHDVVYASRAKDGRSRVLRVSLDGGEPAVLVADGARLPAASTVDERIVYLAGDRESELTPTIFDPRTGHAARLSEALPPGSYHGLAFSPDGKRVLALRREPEIVEVDATTGEVTRRTRLPAQATSMAFARGDLLVTVVRWVGNVWVGDDPFAP